MDQPHLTFEKTENSTISSKFFHKISISANTTLYGYKKYNSSHFLFLGRSRSNSFISGGFVAPKQDGVSYRHLFVSEYDVLPVHVTLHVMITQIDLVHCLRDGKVIEAIGMLKCEFNID